MALYQITQNYVVFEDKLPTKEQSGKLGIKKTNLYTRNGNKQIYSMAYLKEKQADKQYANFKTYKEVEPTFSRVEKKEKRFSEEKASEMYYEKRKDN